MSNWINSASVTGAVLVMVVNLVPYDAIKSYIIHYIRENNSVLSEVQIKKHRLEKLLIPLSN